MLSYYDSIFFFCSPSSLPNWGKYVVSFCPKCLRADVKWKLGVLTCLCQLMSGATKIALGVFLIPGEATNASSGAYSKTV